jgi:hypothetical protein
MTNYRHYRSQRRRGRLTLEILLVLPILLLATFAIFQFGIALLIKQSVVHAATVAAREAGKAADADELVFVVDAILENHGLAIGEDASLVLEDPESVTPVETRGDLPCSPPDNPALEDDEVRVTVCVSMGSPPFLNALKYYGADFSNRRISISSVVRKEEFPDPNQVP